MSRDNTKIALIGCGYWGKNLARNFSELGALKVICDLSEESLDKLRGDYDITLTTDIESVIADPDIDAIALATPAETHYSIARKALEAGKDLYVEKPLALTEEHAQALVDMAKARGLILMVGHILHYHPAVVKMKKLIEAGELGRIQAIYSNRMSLGKIRREENILWSFAPHDVSLIQSIVKEEPAKVFASGGYFLHEKIADTTISVMEYESGVRAHIFVSWLHPFKEQRFVVVGSKKMLVFNDVEKENKLLLYPHEIEWKNQMPAPVKKEAAPVNHSSEEPLKEECRAFLEAIKTRKPPLTDGAEGVRTLRALAALQRSLGSGEVVHMKQAAPGRRYFAHPTAVIDEPCQIGEGTKIWHFSHVMPNARIGQGCNIGQNVFVGAGVKIGRNVKIQNNVSVYEGVELEDNVFCGPSMVFTNVNTPRSAVNRKGEYERTLVREGATLGANCVIVCGATLGKNCFIGAGAVVTHNVKDHALMVGSPARQTGWMCACGEKLSGELECRRCDSAYTETEEGLRELA